MMDKHCCLLLNEKNWILINMQKKHDGIRITFFTFIDLPCFFYFCFSYFLFELKYLYLLLKLLLLRNCYEVLLYRRLYHLSLDGHVIFSLEEKITSTNTLPSFPFSKFICISIPTWKFCYKTDYVHKVEC